MEKRCKFDIEGKCYSLLCYDKELPCGAKDSSLKVIKRATVEEQMARSREIYSEAVQMKVMQPTVINVDNTGSSENVARKEFDTEQGCIVKKMDDVNLGYSREDGK